MSGIPRRTVRGLLHSAPSRFVHGQRPHFALISIVNHVAYKTSYVFLGLYLLIAEFRILWVVIQLLPCLDHRPKHEAAPVHKPGVELGPVAKPGSTLFVCATRPGNLWWSWNARK